MGRILKYRCKKCGCILDTMFLGPGFMGIGMQKGFECMECHNVMGKPVDNQGKILEDEKKCIFCDSKNLVSWDGLCPKCGNKMDSKCIGFWD